MVVSISDIHGYLQQARSALQTLTDHTSLPPVVTADADGTLHWAGENYVLVFNGDLIDRGPSNDGVLRMVARLTGEAPPGRVRVTLGNHEHILTFPDTFSFRGWYSTQVSDQQRGRFIQWIQSSHVVAAYRGYNVTYAHAGRNEPYSATDINDSLLNAAEELADAVGTERDPATQRRLTEANHTIFGTGTHHPKGPSAGLVWLDLKHLSDDAPPQVVGHTRHDTPVQKGAVYCQNVIRNTQPSPGGEAVFVETPNELVSLSRTADGGIEESTLARFD